MIHHPRKSKIRRAAVTHCEPHKGACVVEGDPQTVLRHAVPLQGVRA